MWMSCIEIVNEYTLLYVPNKSNIYSFFKEKPKLKTQTRKLQKLKLQTTHKPTQIQTTEWKNS